MATANIKKIGSGFLAAGATTTKGWNNPPLGKVLGFWVQPRKLAADEFISGKTSFQITKVDSVMDQPNHFVVRVTVKNTSTVGWDFDLYMSYLS
jgi:hypothetical protein